ncbi:dihydrodipicolinate synthase family protein [Martelella radicis]|uniref:4-hydroxy-tetrahydrodipicolinate synthase n=1 Tax=Martelella radicis TaxID=1397476 RepID=A0A7W6PB99_9HYPH|nr:dihydrodipicolinate synthase family protein [Martelella radicis]MBB4123266.1 4-hydroxy-tetrahydrodipicolinate synthase [Martelella radicis]
MPKVLTAAKLTGIHAATICPLTEDFEIDPDALQAHIAEVTKDRRIRGLLINGHAGENAQLSREALARVVGLARQTAPATCFLTAGIYAESTAEAARRAQDAEAAGADAVLIFPPNGWALGQDQETVVAHHAGIATATVLPLVLYQAPVSAGAMAYRPDTLEALAKLPSVAGVKEGSWEVATYEENWRLLQKIRPGLSVMASGDEHLLTCYMIGTTGSQVSLAAIVPGLVCDLFEAASAGDWSRARALHEKLYPLSVAIYRKRTGVTPTARLKACLHILGLIPSARVMPPNRQPEPEEMRLLEDVLRPLF